MDVSQTASNIIVMQTALSKKEGAYEVIKQSARAKEDFSKAVTTLENKAKPHSSTGRGQIVDILA